MKKVLCLIITSFLLLLCACGEKSTDTQESNDHLLNKEEIAGIHERTTSLTLPKEYKNFKYLKNTFYYYDFTSNENTKLGNHYRPVEYIGGTDKFYITSDFYGNLDDHFIKLYVQNSKTKNFEMYDFEKDDLDYPIIGSAILSKNIFLAYKESSFFIIDLSSKAYTAKTYSTAADVLENDEL